MLKRINRYERYFCNPSRLTKREVELLQLYAEHGGYDGVAKALKARKVGLLPRYAIIREKLDVTTTERALEAAGIMRRAA